MELLAVLILVLAAYGGARFIQDLRASFAERKLAGGNATTLGALALVALVAADAFRGAAEAQTAVPDVTLDLDLSVLFESINTYLPTFFGLFAVAGGIAIAIVIARFIINAVRGAFEGKNI